MKVIVCIVSLVLSLSAHAGPDVTGGGDVIVMKFQLAGAKFCSHLKSSSARGDFPFTTEQVCSAVEKVKVSVEERVFLADGSEVDALNIPAKQEVKLSLRRNDSKLNTDYFSLAVHEYISVIGINDKNYAISGAIVMKMGIKEGDLDSPSAKCADVEADYVCEPNDDETVPGYGLPGNAMLRISLRSNVLNYRPTQVDRKSEPQQADGKEKTIEYKKYPSDDATHEEYRTVTCLKDGFKIEGRNTNFLCSGPQYPDPAYSCKLQSRGIGYQRYTFSPDFGKLTFFTR